ASPPGRSWIDATSKPRNSSFSATASAGSGTSTNSRSQERISRIARGCRRNATTKTRRHEERSKKTLMGQKTLQQSRTLSLVFSVNDYDEFDCPSTEIAGETAG